MYYKLNVKQPIGRIKNERVVRVLESIPSWMPVWIRRLASHLRWLGVVPRRYTPLFVGPGGDDDGNGLTWGHRYETINGALVGLWPGDGPIYVGAGEYKEVVTIQEYHLRGVG